MFLPLLVLYLEPLPESHLTLGGPTLVGVNSNRPAPETFKGNQGQPALADLTSIFGSTFTDG